jgi:fumarylacetoacetase
VRLISNVAAGKINFLSFRPHFWETHTMTWLSLPPDTHFPPTHLPWGVFLTPGGDIHAGTRVGDTVIDLSVLYEEGLIALPINPFDQGDLNYFAALGQPAWRVTRNAIAQLLDADERRLQDDADLRERALLPIAHVEMQLPVIPGDYTDFYSSREHATNVGAMLRGNDNALMPNWLHLPVAYHGRASSIVVSGTDITRPNCQSRPGDAHLPSFGPSRSLDYELEVAVIIGRGNDQGCPIHVDDAENHIFGLVLLNDWSARDIQAWEYQPLGPFLGKNFATSISPWVVTLAALEPFRCEAPQQEVEVLPYLREKRRSTFDIQLEVLVEGRRTCLSNFKHLYWTMAQQIAHHTSNGCPLRPGDLLASGTISGPTEDSRGCLLETTQRGSKPITLREGQTRKFLEDGDVVTMTGWCERAGVRIGFGEVSGKILAAKNLETRS